MDKPLKIAQVTNLYESVPPQNKGGLEQMVSYLTEELVSMGHDVTLFGTADSKTTANLVPLWPTAVSQDKPSQIREMSWYADLAVANVLEQADDFDIIHDHTYFVGSRYGHLTSTPILTTMHHPVSFETHLLNEFPPEYRDFAMRQDQHFLKETTTVTVSEFQRMELQKQLNRKGVVIHNGIPLSEWQDPNLDTGSYFAYLGYISGNKGVYEAIQATLSTEEILKIAGPIDDHDENSKKYFSQKVEPFIDEKQIQYVGGLNLKEKQEFLKNAKATLMPIQWDEPFGLVAIESLAMGTPVIAFNRGALPEIIENGVSGFLVNSVEEMTSRMHEVNLLSRHDARNKYEENFTARSMAIQYEEFYRSLIN